MIINLAFGRVCLLLLMLDQSYCVRC